jgi:hypothetical protein
VVGAGACSGVDERGTTRSEPLDCSFLACGGDVVGDWQIEEGCVDDPAASSLQGCPDSVVTFAADVSGTVSFQSDGTYALSTTVGGTRNYRVPSACIAGGTCDDVAQSITASCSATAASCECSSQVESANTRRAGTYSASASALTLLPSGGSEGETRARYCVEGTRLSLQLEDASGKVTLLRARR